jgi:plasmid stability protein
LGVPQVSKQAGDEKVNVLVVMPVDLHQKVKDRARREERSMAAYIRHVLREKVEEFPT